MGQGWQLRSFQSMSPPQLPMSLLAKGEKFCQAEPCFSGDSWLLPGVVPCRPIAHLPGLRSLVLSMSICGQSAVVADAFSASPFQMTLLN